MNNFTTKLIEALVKGESIKEIFIQEPENAINKLLKYKLTAFLDYEKHDPIGYNTGNSRNEYYTRKIDTSAGTLNIDVPRDRLGDLPGSFTRP